MRALVPWNAFQDLTGWHRDIDDLFNRFFGNFFADEGQVPVNSSLPAMEAYRKDGNYIVRLDLPGVDPKEVDISVVEDTLVIKGERKRTREVTDRDYHYREAGYGRFQRSLTLPRGVDRDKITARYENGVLEISMSLPESVAGRKVPIEIAGSEVKQLKTA